MANDARRGLIWRAAWLVAVVLILIPFLDRPAPGEKPKPLWTWLALIALAYIVVLTWLGYTMNPTA